MKETLEPEGLNFVFQHKSGLDLPVMGMPLR